LDTGNKRFLIEKMVAQSRESYRHLVNEFKRHSGKGWVNTVRRCFSAYHEIKKMLAGNNAVSLSVDGGNWGLGSNAIHFVDLFEYLSGSPCQELEGKYLDNGICPSHRSPKLCEFSGTIIGTSDNNGVLKITFAKSHMAPVVLTIAGQNCRFIVDEGKEKAWAAKKSENWEWREFPFHMVFTSQLTASIAKGIFSKDTCDLPTLEESQNPHSLVFKVLNSHIQKLKGTRPKLCPIT
jgi:hypothetical protein